MSVNSNNKIFSAWNWIENLCDLPRSRNEGGIECMAYIPKVFYNHTSNKCEDYIYGGCGASANSFSTVEECEEACGAHKH